MDSHDRFSAPRSATSSSSPERDRKSKSESAPPLLVVVPTTPETVDSLDECIQGIMQCTPIDFSLTVALEGEIDEETTGEVVAMLGGINRTNKWKLMESANGINHSIDRDLGNSMEQFVVVVPADRVIKDPEWFGKMQMPFTKDSTCGMSFAFDNMAGNTRPPHRWDHRYKIPGTVFMVPRFAIDNARRAIKFAVADSDYADCFKHALVSLGLSAWGVPSARIYPVVRQKVVPAEE
jgi:hypothetical protein